MKQRANPNYIVAAVCVIAVTGLLLGLLIPRLQSRTEETERLKYGTPNIAEIYDLDMADSVLEHLNRGRVAAGMKPLKVDAGALEKAAKARAKELTVYFGHQRPAGQSWQTVFDQFHVRGRLRGENLASGQSTPEAVYSSWWDSTSHKENMMNPDFSYTSIVCLEYNNTLYWVQLFR